MPVRPIKHTINGQTYIYGTTLIGEQYSIDDFSDLYHESMKDGVLKNSIKYPRKPLTLKSFILKRNEVLNKKFMLIY